MPDRVMLRSVGRGEWFTWAVVPWLLAVAGCVTSSAPARRVMTELRHGMSVVEVDAIVLSEGGALEREECLGEPAIARYYRVGNDLLRVDCVGARGRRVRDYYIYTPGVERRRLQEEAESAKEMEMPKRRVVIPGEDAWPDLQW